MATTIQHSEASVDTGNEVATRAAPEVDGQPTIPRLTTEQVWHQLAKASFAVLSHVTPAGKPRSAASSTRPSDASCTWWSPPMGGRPSTSRPAVGSP
jgi:hypothetical protein